jgi:phosphonate transport system substrate-binding protein
MTRNLHSFVAIAGLTLASLLAAVPASSLAQDCKSRGDLDARYCDDNGDMVADTPKDPKKLKTPNTLVFTYTPVEDPAVYEKVFKPFTDHLGQCTGKRVVFYQVQSNAAEIEAMRSAGDCTWAASPPAPLPSRSTSRAPCRSPSRATRRTSRATT